MSEHDKLHDLIGDDPTPEELARLRRVDALLRSVPGPPAQVPSSLTGAVTKIGLEQRMWTRRRVAVVAAFAAALSALFFGLGSWAGSEGESYRFTVAMEGTKNAPQATALVRVGERDPETGNYRLEVEVAGLPKLPGNRYYDLWLAKDGQYAATCGTFNVASGTTTVHFTVSYRLEEFDRWVISEGRRDDPPWLLSAPVTQT